MKYIRYLFPCEHYCFHNGCNCYCSVDVGTILPITQDFRTYFKGYCLNVYSGIKSGDIALFDSKEHLHQQLVVEKLLISELLEKTAIIQIRYLNLGFDSWVLYDCNGEEISLKSLDVLMPTLRTKNKLNPKAVYSWHFTEFIKKYANDKSIPIVYMDNRHEKDNRWKSKFELRNFPKSAYAKKSTISVNPRDFKIGPFLALLKE